MNRLKYSILLPAVALAISADAANSTVPTALQDELARYCTPLNQPSSPRQMLYMPDGESFLQLNDEATSIIKYDIKSGSQLEVVFDLSANRGSKIDAIEGFSLSDDGAKLLIYTDVKMIYRNSFEAKYYVFEIKRNMLKPLSETHPLQQAPLFSPDGRMVAFVADNNIYIKKLDYETEVAVTTDGRVNEIINGIPDWTYQEEFGSESSIAWAPDNLTLCYIKYNETDVPVYSLSLYEGACNPQSQYALYPGEFSYKYPVAGEKNSIVSVHSYDVETRKTKDIALPDARIEYIPRISYATDPNRLIVTTLNRQQTRLEMYSVNPKSTVAKSLYVDESNAWIDPTAWELVTYYPEFFVISSEKSGFNQLYQYSYSGALMHQLTSSDNVVTDYYGYDSAKGIHYYQATSTPLDRVVYSLDLKGKTTALTPLSGTASASFSPSMSHYTINYSNATTPPVYKLYSTKNNKELRVLESNSDYASLYADVPQKEFFKFSSDGVDLNGYIIKPQSFDASRRYPVIMSQYSGPGSQSVLNRWKLDWEQFFANQGYIIICVDGRGTGGRGREFQNVVYQCLGKYETIDQIAAARYAASLPYVDPLRIGIHGWSYGGYETIMAISSDNSPYAAAVAVAPVTDWRYYDTVYAERYMLTPRENESGYEESAPINFVDKVNCPLLIMTGTADDNVHPANTVEYVSRLLNAGKMCDMLLFPNMNHSIYYCNGRVMVYAKMLDYFNRNMK